MNVVFVMADQQRADSLGEQRHPCADYPALERFREESIEFTRFYASAIPCVPSRLAMLSGRQEWMSRGYGNAKLATGDDTTWMSALRDAGYRCVSVGKTHMVHAGSAHVQVPVGRSFGTQSGWDHFHPAISPEPEESYFDVRVASRACDMLGRLAAQDGPFALFVGFHAPHEPYVMPERYYARIRPDETPLPPARAENEYETKSRSYRDRAEHFRRLFGSLSDRTVRAGIAAHHAMVGMVDDCFGRILERIGALGLSETTAVVFCSDHGDLLGEHGIFNKAATFYESEIRVPFLLRLPNAAHAGTRVTGFASGVDVFPTILELAGVHADVSLPGHSLLPAVRGEKPGRPYVTCTNTHGMMLRTPHAKLWLDARHGDGELYDLDNDPLELTNRYDDSSAGRLRADLTELLLRARMQDDLRHSRPTQRERLLHQEWVTADEPEIV